MKNLNNRLSNFLLILLSLMAIAGLFNVEYLKASGFSGGGADVTYPIVETKGGTGQSTYTKNDLLYAADDDTLAKVSSQDMNPTNLLASGSGGMELWPDGTTSDPFGWALAGGTVARDDTTIKYGAYSQKTTNSGGSALTSSQTMVEYSYFKGRSVCGSAWVSASTASRARLRIWDGVGNIYSDYHTGGSSWEFLSGCGTLDASATIFTLQLRIETGGAIDVYWDAVIVNEGPIPMAFAEGPMNGGRRLQFRAYADSNDSINDATATKVTLDAETEDLFGIFDSASNYRYTPGEDGHYMITGCVMYASPVADQRYAIQFYKNGVQVTNVFNQASMTDVLSACASDIIWLDEDDYIELYTYHTAGGAETISGLESNTFISGSKID